MVTPNTDSTFTQVKSDDSLGTFTRQNGVVADVIRVTKRLRTGEKSRGDNLLLSMIDETVKQIFNEAGAEVIYNSLENNFHLKRKEIAEKPKVFSAVLERLFGSVAPVVERIILINLYLKFELKFAENDGYEFSDHVKALRKRCGERRSKR